MRFTSIDEIRQIEPTLHPFGDGTVMDAITDFIVRHRDDRELAKEALAEMDRIMGAEPHPITTKPLQRWARARRFDEAQDLQQAIAPGR